MMRRKDKELTDRDVIDSIIRQTSVCRLAMVEGDLPYVIPLCFGYEKNTLYFHSAAEGRKLEILHKNSNVCFEMDIDQELVCTDDRCTMRYRSVIGMGKASFLDEPVEKRKALDIIMRHYSKEPRAYPEAALKRTTIIKVEIEAVTGKVYGY
jgi:nitroimidazol reductase NimA-like FMN-containing flavoprotein (pyridoxamine 5'-phosphate oxidase superfamily)